jgi:hypothetical protein
MLYSTTPENPMFFKAVDEWRVEPYEVCRAVARINEVRVGFEELRKKQRLKSRCASFLYLKSTVAL